MPIRQYVSLLGTTFPFYGICVGVALLAIGIWIIYNFKKFKMDGDLQNEILYGFPFMVLTGLFFAFALDALFTGEWRTWTGNGERRVGFTFMGWLFGAVLFISMFGGFTSFGRMFLLNMFLPVFALAQGIGRIGCLLGGCCYGKICSCGIKYPPGSLPYERIGDVCVFPIQLVEAVLLFFLFSICLKFIFKYRAVVYLIGVAAIRFVVEFFRGDIRGNVPGVACLSPQQLMSILFFIIGLIVLLIVRQSDIHGRVVTVQPKREGVKT